MGVLVNNEIIEKKKGHTIQSKLSHTLNEEKLNIQASISALRTLALETIKMQYMTLPNRFLLVLEGSKANSRKKITKLRDFFCNTKTRNQLASAFGTWKIFFVAQGSVFNQAAYKKKAGAHLMVGWLRNMIKRSTAMAIKKYVYLHFILL